MSNANYELKKASIDAIPDNEALEPTMPVAIMLQEAEDLCEWAKDDKNALLEAGLEPIFLDEIPVRAGALRHIQSVWQKEYKVLENAQIEWAAKAPGAFDLRDTLVHDYLFAYRKAPDLLAKTQKIAEGDGNADMIQDLSDLVELGRANLDPLRKINLDMGLLDRAEKLSGELPVLLGKTNGLRNSDNKMKITRDKAYTHLKEAVDEVRAHGQFKFWRNEARKKGYVSKYYKLHNKPKVAETPVTENPK